MASKLSTWWQKSKLRSWWMKIKSGLHWLWQRIKQHPFITVGIVVALLAIIAFTLAVYMFGWDWTGLTGGESKITKTPQETTIEYSPGKNLWDWMQLLLIPILLAIGGYWFNQIQKSRDEKTAEAQKQREENDTKEREKLERESREDNQRETALQAYLDKMSELLLEKHLRDSAEEDEVRKIARARTLTMLRGLDPVRKASVIQFLHESSLIDKDTCIISLRGANLSAANLSHADLSSADLSSADLSSADLSSATLRGATLRGATLSSADLSSADLSNADLYDATLSNAKLRGATLSSAYLHFVDLSSADLSSATFYGADLSNAKLHFANLVNANLERTNLSNADLYGTDVRGAQLIAADLSGAMLSQQQLDQVSTCIGTTLPKGLTCHHNLEMV